MNDIRDYERLARETGAYRDIEFEILDEYLHAWAEKPDGPNALVELRDGKTLAGFALLCRVVSTDFTFDVCAFCIDSSYAETGAGKELLAMIEKDALGHANSAIVRFEMSKRKEKAVGKGLLTQAGYALIGHIPDFYGPGDDYFMYAKHVFAARSES
ncbi:MAG: GNAT family N-acetyltransferase [Rectinemataceae bacterium]